MTEPRARSAEDELREALISVVKDHTPQVNGDSTYEAWLTCLCGWDSSERYAVDWMAHLVRACDAASPSHGPDLREAIEALPGMRVTEFYIEEEWVERAAVLALLDARNDPDISVLGPHAMKGGRLCRARIDIATICGRPAGHPLHARAALDEIAPEKTHD